LVRAFDFFVGISVSRIEVFFEPCKRVGLVIGGNDILSLPCGGGRAFEVGQTKAIFALSEVVGW